MNRRQIGRHGLAHGMLTVTLALTLLLGFSLGLVGGSASASSDGEQPLYYYSGDLRVELVLALDEIMVYVPGGDADVQSRAGAQLQQVLPDAEVSLDADAERVLVRFDQAEADRNALAGRSAEFTAAGYVVEGVAYPRTDIERTEGSRRIITSRLIVKPGPHASIDELALAYKVQVLGTMAALEDVYILDAADAGLTSSVDIANAMYEREGVIYAQPEVLRQHERRATIPNDPLFNRQWHLRNTGQKVGGIPGIDVNAPEAWSRGTGSGVNIVVVDDGVQLTHPDIEANARPDLSFDYRTGTQNINLGPDDNHGTAVAGLAAAVGDNAIGVAGSGYDASIIGVRLIGGSLSEAQIASAIGHQGLAEEPGDLAHINTNSWGPPDRFLTTDPIDGPIEDSLQNGIELGRDGKGIVYLWAAGNGRDFGDWSNYDGFTNSRYTIAVACTKADGTYPWYSEPGSCVLVTAPGDEVSTTDRTGGSGYVAGDYVHSFNGTSAATPIAAGVVALMLDVNPDLTWRDVQHILVDSSRKNDPNHPGWAQNGSGRWFSHDYGYGMVDAGAATLAAASWVNVPEEAAPLTSPTQTPGMEIPDNDPEGITDSVTIADPGGFFIEHVEVEVNIDHTWQGDLRVELISPSGMTSMLGRERPNNSTQNLNFRFVTVAHWGEDPNGEWTLRVSDRQPQNVGTLNSWSMRIFGHRREELTDWWVTPDTDFTSSGVEGGAFSPNSQIYTLSSTDGGFDWTIGGLPTWLDAAPGTSGSVDAGGSTDVTLSLNQAAANLAAGQHKATVLFRNETNGQVATRRVVVTIDPSGTRPTVSNLQLSPSNPTSNASIRLTYTFSDPRQRPEETRQIRWYRDGERQPEWNNRIDLPPEATTGSEVWFAEIRVNNGEEWSRWHESPIVIIQNQPPTMQPVPALEGEVTEEITYQVEATDPDGGALTYSMTLVAQASGQYATDYSIDPVTGFFRWDTSESSPGTFRATFKAEDTGRPPLSVQRTTTITLIPFCPVPDAPSDVQATHGDFSDRIRITYSPVEGAVKYRVYRSESPDEETASFIGSWPQTTFDDYSIAKSEPTGVGCPGNARSASSGSYYYWVSVDNGCKIGERQGPASGFAGSSSATRAKAYRTAYEPVIPSFELADDMVKAPMDSELAIRLRADIPIDPDSVWGIVAFGEQTSDLVYWLPNDETDGWVSYWPTEAFAPGSIVTMTVGGSTVYGDVLEPITYKFGIESEGEYQVRAVEEVGVSIEPIAIDSTTSPPPLDGAVGPAYRIAPDLVYDDAQEFLLPLPSGVSPKDVRLHYYLANGPNKGWYPAENVENWLVGEVTVELIDGVPHMQFAVTHSGVIQLGAQTGQAAPAGANSRRMGDLALLALVCLGLAAAGRKRARALQRI